MTSAGIAPARETRSVPAPDGPVEVLVTGAGAPVSAFLPGLTGSIAQTRPFGSGVEGTRVFAHLAGHGTTALPATSTSPGPDVGYPMLGRQARAVLDAVCATGALGVSMGAGRG